MALGFSGLGLADAWLNRPYLLLLRSLVEESSGVNALHSPLASGVHRSWTGNYPLDVWPGHGVLL